MSDRATLEVVSDGDGRRVDAYLADRLENVSRMLAATLIRAGKVRVNGARVKPSHRLAASDRIDVEVDYPPTLSAEPEEIPIEIVYRDSDLLVVDKPAGLVVHPAPGNTRGTLANALAALYPQTRNVGARERPGIVHRLDKDTSGLMVVALTPAAMASLQRQIASREAGRRYLALTTGHLDREQGTVEAPVGRDPTHRRRMATHGLAARPASTSFRVLERLPGFDLLEAQLHTGRTHQIRVHLQALGHPITGDRLYGGGEIPDLHRQFLHAHYLELRSPSTGENLQFRSPLPDDLSHVLDRLRTAPAS